jgi:hypothetical protein
MDDLHLIYNENKATPRTIIKAFNKPKIPYYREK